MSAYNGYKYGVVNGNVQRKTQLKPMPPRLHLPGEQPEPIVTTYWERVNQKLEFSFGARRCAARSHRIHLFYRCSAGRWINSGVRLRWRGWSLRSSPLTSNQRSPSTDLLKEQDQRRRL